MMTAEQMFINNLYRYKMQQRTASIYVNKIQNIKIALVSFSHKCQLVNTQIVVTLLLLCQWNLTQCEQLLNSLFIVCEFVRTLLAYIYEKQNCQYEGSLK